MKGLNMGNSQVYIGIALFVIFLILDAVLYAFNTALENVNENEVDKKAAEGNKRAIKLKKMIDDPSGFSDTLDIVVFITNVVSGGYILGTVRNYVSGHMVLSTYWLSLIIGAVMLSVLIVFGVIIPKKCGRRSPLKISMRLVSIAKAIVVLLFPITALVTLISHLILRIFRINPNDGEDNVTEEEIITMVNEGQEQGVLEPGEAEMIANIFEMGDKTAGDIMTHRSAIVAIDCHMTLEQLIQSQIDGNYSRFPVYNGDIDNIVGTLHIRDALILYRNIPNRRKELNDIKTLIRPAFFVPETRDIDDLLKEMQARKVHMGIVVDEYGQTAGVISLEDIIEEIVGNIMDEYDVEEDNIKYNADDSYVVDGLTELGDLNKLLGTSIESDEYETLNGFLISKLDRIPDEAEQDVNVNDSGWNFKVLEISGNVIRKVEITRDKNEQADSKEKTDRIEE